MKKAKRKKSKTTKAIRSAKSAAVPPTGTMTRAKEIAKATSRPISAIRQSMLGVYRHIQEWSSHFRSPP